MGDYITQTDLDQKISAAVLIEMTDDTGAGAVDLNNMNAMIDEAEGEANAYMGKRYTVPLSPVPKIIKAMVLDMAVYKLHGRREGATEDVEKRYKDAVAFFRRVASNEISLGVNTPDPPGTASKADIKSGDRAFTRDSMKGF